MNKTLLEFNDLAIAAGIEQGSPFLARSLGSTVKRFEELAKNVTHESGFEEDEENPVLSAEQFVVDQPRPSNPRRRAAASKTHPAVLGYQTTLEEEADDYDGEIAQQDLATQAQLENLPDSSDWTSTEAMQHYQVEMPDPTSASEAATLSMQQHRIDVANIANTTEDSMTTFSEKSPYGFYALPLPKSYSHQETSFARRLLRSAVEDSYRIMTDPTSRPEDKRRLCKFTWCFTNSSKVVEHLEKIIAKTAKDNLERWEVPQLHLGGAGLHYPRVGIDAGGAPPAWWANDAPMGPWPVGQPETPPVPNSMAISQIIRKAGVDGVSTHSELLIPLPYSL